MTRKVLALTCLVALGAAPASARPLPKVEVAPAARPCPELGAGFVRLPGSDICVKLSGDVRVEVMQRSGNH